MIEAESTVALVEVLGEVTGGRQGQTDGGVQLGQDQMNVHLEDDLMHGREHVQDDALGGRTGLAVAAAELHAFLETEDELSIDFQGPVQPLLGLEVNKDAPQLTVVELDQGNDLRPEGEHVSIKQVGGEPHDTQTLETALEVETPTGELRLPAADVIVAPIKRPTLAEEATNASGAEAAQQRIDDG